MPEDSVKEELKNIIHSFSNNYGGPKFEPHVTLVSSFLGSEKELLQKTEMLSKEIKPFEIFFDGITYLDEFFRALFLKVKITTKLKIARDFICRKLDYNDYDYIPHLSLAFGDYNKKEKQKMISAIKSLPNGFSVDSIYLAHNDEINLKWKVIQEFSLK
jgi:2'-5' RNA ligase